MTGIWRCEPPDMAPAACGRQLQAAVFRTKADCSAPLMREAGLLAQHNGAGLAGFLEDHNLPSFCENGQMRPKVSMRPTPLHACTFVDPPYAIGMQNDPVLGHHRLHFHGGGLACQS